MDSLRLFLCTAFCQYPLSKESEYNGSTLLNRRDFIDCVRQFKESLSDDSIELVLRLYADKWSKEPDGDTKSSNLFYSIIYFTKNVLHIKGGEPVVVFDQLFKWHDVTYILGEDLPICAALAYEERFKNKQLMFTWTSVIGNDNADLNYLFEKEGLSDLHQHLKASADLFSISWICLMNHVRHRRDDFCRICKDGEEATRLYELYLEAALIRVCLFEMLRGKKCSLLKDKVQIVDFNRTSLLQNYISDLAADFHHTELKDYAQYGISNGKNVLDIFVGERRLLYFALREIYLHGRNAAILTKMLFRYLQIKMRIREKMVQTNNNVGFANFDRYEKRKETFLESYPRYASLLKQIPVYEAARKHQVKYIETRIAPKAPSTELLKTLRSTRTEIEKPFGEKTDAHYELLLHYIKKKDRGTGFVPLNYQVRKEVQRQAIALRTALERRNGCVVGIDAANSEFFCRPEVFAHAYRYLAQTGISCTYHVGEDFYDIVDGLRAINEAITFLHLKRGDRMGHCIALGIDTSKYYIDHNHYISIPRQNMLDNLVWLFFSCKEYGIAIPPKLEMSIKTSFSELVQSYHCHDMWEYRKAMYLRGDDPFFSWDDVRPNHTLGDWNSFAVDNSEPVNTYRQQSSVRQLYAAYHFSYEVRKKMETVAEYAIGQEYIDVVSQLQERMMDDIERKGIVIECCPTSNLKIGRLGTYSSHAIFRFLSTEQNTGHHLPVTINTDDLGIFPTSLPSEYSLIALALMKDHHCNQAKANRWMKQVIENGHKYRFGKTDK